MLRDTLSGREAVRAARRPARSERAGPALANEPFRLDPRARLWWCQRQRRHRIMSHSAENATSASAISNATMPTRAAYTAAEGGKRLQWCICASRGAVASSWRVWCVRPGRPGRRATRRRQWRGARSCRPGRGTAAGCGAGGHTPSNAHRRVWLRVGDHERQPLRSLRAALTRPRSSRSSSPGRGRGVAGMRLPAAATRRSASAVPGCGDDLPALQRLRRPREPRVAALPTRARARSVFRRRCLTPFGVQP